MTAVAATHLANSPAGGVLVALVIAIVLFVVAAVAAAMTRAFWAAIVCTGLAFFVLAFLLR